VLGRALGLPPGRSALTRETIAGFTTFFAMSYVIFVNPAILGLQGTPDAARACRPPPPSPPPASSQA